MHTVFYPLLFSFLWSLTYKKKIPIFLITNGKEHHVSNNHIASELHVAPSENVNLRHSVDYRLQVCFSTIQPLECRPIPSVDITIVKTAGYRSGQFNSKRVYAAPLLKRGRSVASADARSIIEFSFKRDQRLCSVLDVPRVECARGARGAAQRQPRSVEGGGRAAVHPGGGAVGGAAQRSSLSVTKKQERGRPRTHTPGDLRSRGASLRRGGNTACLRLEQYRQTLLRR